MAPKKTIEDYELEEAIRAANKEERGISDDKYAAKIVEKIVLTFVSLFALGILGYLGQILVQAIKYFH